MAALFWVTAVICAFGLGVGFSNTVKAFIAKALGQAEDAAKAKVAEVKTDIKSKL